MNKKLISLAVAAALVAPAAAMAEAVLYGKVNMSIDYQSIENDITPVYNDTAFGNAANPPLFPGQDIFVAPDGSINALKVPTGTVLTQAQANAVRGYSRLAPGQTFGGTSFEGWSLNKGPNMNGESRANRLGVKGSEDLGGGLKAIYQIELGIEMANYDQNLVNNERGTGISMRNTFAGLAGSWGTALAGRHDTPLKISTGKLDMFADTMADFNGIVGFQNYRADNAVAYISPSFSGFTFAGAMIPAGGATGGAGYNINNDSIGSGYSLAGIYSNGPFYATVAYELLGSDTFMNSAASMNDCFANSVVAGTYRAVSFNGCNKIEDDQDTWLVGLGLLDWNGFTLSGVYEEQNNLPQTQNWLVAFDPTNPLAAASSFNLPSGPDSKTMWQIQAGYAFGNMQLKAAYGEASTEGRYNIGGLGAQNPANYAVYAEAADNFYEGTQSSWVLGADYNFSKRTKAYVLYTAISNDQNGTPRDANGVQLGGTGSDWDGFSLGMMHSF